MEAEQEDLQMEAEQADLQQIARFTSRWLL
jgi:hypothetical protein